MNKQDVIIVGAGAAGLMAAYELTKAGKIVTILEARERLGGRVYTHYDKERNIYLELGAEFVHGDLPITARLLKEAVIPYVKAEGRMWQVNVQSGEAYTVHAAHWKLFEDKLKEVTEDITIAEFLKKYFDGDEYIYLRASVEGYASGYDTADVKRASTIALRNEWLEEDWGAQYKIGKGYGAMIDYMADECTKKGNSIHLASIVKQINWKQNEVEIITEEGKKYYSGKVVITVPPGILYASLKDKASISFRPEVPEKINAAKMIGYGAVLKVLLLFEYSFWENISSTDYPAKTMKDLGFVLSSETIPTWWTQYPENTGLLTGWLGGPRAEKIKNASDPEILEKALKSIAKIFKLKTEDLKKILKEWYIVNWTNDAFAKGSYSYATLETQQGRKILNDPIDNTLFFCGEALANEAEMGTVEAALESGMAVAKKILDN